MELLDGDVGRLMRALDTPERRRDTLVIFTSDHGPGVCEMKCTLTDRGTGVVLIVRGPSDEGHGPGHAFRGGRVVDALTQHLDLYPTLCDAVGGEPPPWLQGVSLLPLVRDESGEIHDHIFTEQTYHWGADPRPLRAVRGQRYKYIRSFKADQPRGVDGGPAQKFWNRYGYAEQSFPDETLFNLIFDPNEANNLAGSPDHAEVLADYRRRLADWMEATDDPLKDGRIPAPPAAGFKKQGTALTARADGQAARGSSYPIGDFPRV